MLKLAGVDEVGRGCLAGPVMAAAVILPPEKPVPFVLKDSKELSPEKRTLLMGKVKEFALAWSVGSASVEEIDSINILQASLLAMKRAVDGLSIMPDQVYVDGNRLPGWKYPSKAIIKGDQSEPAIMAASILAKVIRDQEMIELGKRYPEYGLEKHKGYGTKFHLNAIEKFGVTCLHRRSFAPVKRLIEEFV